MYLYDWYEMEYIKKEPIQFRYLCYVRRFPKDHVEQNLHCRNTIHCDELM